MMEMVLALFAVILFSSVALSYNQAIWRQTDYLFNAQLVVQCNHLCHEVLDEVDAKLFSKQLGFDNIISTYNNKTRSVTIASQSETYNLLIKAAVCDSFGVVMPADSLSLFRRVDVSVSGPPALKRPVNMYRLYTRTYM
jgi:hypothetical protein